MAGMKVVVVKCDTDGNVDLDDLRKLREAVCLGDGQARHRDVVEFHLHVRPKEALLWLWVQERCSRHARRSVGGAHVICAHGRPKAVSDLMGVSRGAINVREHSSQK